MADISVLINIMARLRDPQTGCPWDKAQNFETIVPFTLEEAYEVADTIETMALDELPNELGDLLFQIIFYCQLGKEQGLFDFETVIERICQKLQSRHPHVFGNCSLSDLDKLKDNWESIKSKERSKRALNSVLDDIPLAIPALSRSVKIQKRVARVGFDWDTLEPVVEKIHEEIAEVLHEVEQVNVAQEKVSDEVGDLLFAVVNLARHLDVDPETALRGANRKFERRFRGVESQVVASGRVMQEHSLEELESYWGKEKQLERRNKT